MMEKEEFYEAVASILGVDVDYIPSLGYRRRWGQRFPGNGRYEGYGIIRWFSETSIHMALYSPWSIVKTFDDPEEALAVLRAKFIMGL